METVATQEKKKSPEGTNEEHHGVEATGAESQQANKDSSHQKTSEGGVKSEASSEGEKINTQANSEPKPSGNGKGAPQGGAQAPVSNSDADSFTHLALMKANGLKMEDLPKELRMKINAWNMGMRKYNKQRTEKLMEMMKKGSVVVADAIQNWIERDLPEKSEAEIKAAQEKAAQEKAAQERAEAIRNQIAERKRKEAEGVRSRHKPTEEARRQPPVQTNEQKVAAILEQKGKIHYKELTEILGQDVGEEVHIGSIKLLNVFLTNNYKQIK